MRNMRSGVVGSKNGWTSFVGGLGALLVGGAASAAAGISPGLGEFEPLLGSGSKGRAVIVVEEGEDTLHAAVAAANAGDVLLLRPGLYEVSHTVVIDKDLTIRGATHNPEDVHIAAIDGDEFDFEVLEFPDILDRGHIFFARPGAREVAFGYFTIKNAPETDISELECEAEPPFGFGLNHSECFGDAIHADGVAVVIADHVVASLNAGNGIWVDGAEKAIFSYVTAVNNGAFGIDVDTALDLRVNRSTFTANQISGIEASGHVKGTHRDDYTATVDIRYVEAVGNGEIGIEVERFRTASLLFSTARDNREDGFDADRVSGVRLFHCAFINNLDDAIELFPAGDGVPPEEQPADFPGSTNENFRNLVFSGNVGEDINRPPTEN